MFVKKIAFGGAKEAYLEKRLNTGFNIIYSDDNNKGKTIVIQSALYAIGNEPIFPSSFNYKDYYHYVELELDNGQIIVSCRKGDSFVIKTGDGITLLDSVSELKRFLSRNGMVFPKIVKDGVIKIVDPVLFYQLFFVGQDNKNSATIFHDGYYKKEDFWSLVYSVAGLDITDSEEIDSDTLKQRIVLLTEEKKVLLSKNEILKKNIPSIKFISQKQGNDAFSMKVKKIESVREKIVEVTKNRNRALQRKTINEKTLKEIRSLNRTPESGDLHCLDCGSQKIGYSSGDKSYTFDISDVGMRKNITESIQDKINAYQEEIDSCIRQINVLQRQLQELLKEEDINLESVLMYKNLIVDSTDADTRIAEIDKEINKLKAQQKAVKQKSQFNNEKREELRKSIVQTMNVFYKQVDPSGTLFFDDLFSNRSSVYSGSEETEFYLSKLYSLAKILDHKYPIMMDYFRDGELSTDKEDMVIKLFDKLSNQIIFSATLKEQELGKYFDYENINAIDYSSNEDSHILSNYYVTEFKKLLKELMVNI